MGPVLDYRELNAFVESHTGDNNTAVCAEKVRAWRQLQGDLKIVDLKDAYLQIRVSQDLWQYQIVKFRGKMYALTRLGFGLTCAPRVMSVILKHVLAQDETVRRATDHYIDDIMVQEAIVSAEKVREHLLAYGLVSKPPEGLDGGRVLGIAIKRNGTGQLRTSRGSRFVKLSTCDSLTKRELFSLCGRLTGHYPVVLWVRPHCSFLKRLGTDGRWRDPVSESGRLLAKDLLKRCHANDPVRGDWRVNRDGAVTVWTDASSLALGVVVQVDDSVVEDASWLRKKDDHFHINVAELEAVAKGINLAIQWGFKTFTVATDSQTVLSWMECTVDGRDRVRTKGAAQMLIKRRLAVIRQTIEDYHLNVSFRFVSTVENKADTLTRVAKKWVAISKQGSEVSQTSEAVTAVAAAADQQDVRDVIWKAHLPHHCGVDRTLFLASQMQAGITRDTVRSTVDECVPCQRVDPAARAENQVARGDLSVASNWTRIACDVTHYHSACYLTMVDCGPSRFAIWRQMPNETAAAIVAHLHQVVIERGPCVELLLDNSTAFRSETVEQFADNWGISLRFRAAYATSGNGIVERNHRTIKRMAERGEMSPELAAYWYNMTPRKGLEEGSVPSNQLFSYRWRPPYAIKCAAVNRANTEFAIGEEVWVKPNVPSCTTWWRPGRVTAILSKHTVCIDGMPRHVRDVRKRRGQAADQVQDDSDGEDDFADAQEDFGPAAAENGDVRCPAADEAAPPQLGVEEQQRQQPEVVPAPADQQAVADRVLPRRSDRVRRKPLRFPDYVRTDE